MDAVTRFLNKLGFLLRRRKFLHELDEEMAFHRELTEQDMRSDGVGPDAARHAARRQFGNDLRLKEQSHEVVSFRMESVWQDCRFAMRQWQKNPGFALTAILVLTLGMAASVSIFAFVDAALLQPLPYKDPARLVAVFETAATCPHCNLSYQDYLDWKRDNTVFDSLEAWGYRGYLWKGPAGVQSVEATRVSGGFFHTLGVSPVLGRLFRQADDAPGAPRTVVLSYGTWQKSYGGRQDIVGQPVMLDDDAFTVIGVLPREFHYALRGQSDFWTTLHDPNSCEKRRGCHSLFGVARLKEGVSVAAALANVKAIAEQLETQYPDSNKGQDGLALPLSEVVVGDIRPILLVLLGGAVLLLLIACVNVASLLLVRAENRRREMAVRGALGASPARLMRQFVTEGMVLAACGMLLGLAAAEGAMHLLLKLIPTAMLNGMPYLQTIGLTPRVLAFALVVSLLAAAVFALTPALRFSTKDLRGDLAEGGRTAAGTAWRRLGSNLVALELAIAVVLLAGAGLLGKSFYRLLHVDLNFSPDHLATLVMDAPPAAYGKDEQQVALSQRLLERVARIPGVVSVGHTGTLPVTCHCNTTWFRILGHPYNGEHNEAPEREVSPGYFATLQTKLVRGRFFTDADNAASTPVIVINEALAKQYFPGEDPIGKMIGDTSLSPKSMRQVVGVIGNIREGRLDDPLSPSVYYPFKQSPDYAMYLAVRTQQDPKLILPALAAAVREIDPNIGVRDEMTMEQRVNDSQTAYLHRSSAWLVGGFAALALLLGVVGLYGVIAYSVSQRTREIGVRIALGAQRSTVHQMILKEAGLLILAGIGAGLLGSIATASMMQSLLFGVSAWDISTLLAVAVVLGIAALAASYIPARRAASVNPMEALRAE